MASFKVLETQFQMLIKSRIYLDDEYVVMTRNYFLQYTQLVILEFRDTLIQHIESVKKSIDERAQHKQEYDNWVNERQIQKTEGKVDSSKALDASLVDTESSGTALKEQDTSNISGNDAHADDADFRKSQWLRYKRLLKSISLLLDNSILSNLNSIIKERLTRMLNNVMTNVLCLLSELIII
ncbi:hypothetical protein Tco_0858954 [Tanacetum coccineum]|uniref:Uncharacterized protein n=1 Tax=Tanacetum coccineum TaxID=301880 RepID=A0ABQ5BCS9_9ASTR